MATKFIVKYVAQGYAFGQVAGPFDERYEAEVEANQLRYNNFGKVEVAEIETIGCCEDCRHKLGIDNG